MRRATISFKTLLIMSLGLAMPPRADAALVPSADGMTVYDTVLHVTWLADANFAAKKTFDVAGINTNGSMNYSTAVAWVAAMNAYNGGAGYLGHNNWTLPTTPLNDGTCNLIGPNGSFGVGCTNSALGSLFSALGFQFPDTAVPIPANTVGPFINFQPYLYWSGTENGRDSNGYYTFSFNSGWQGGNLNPHYMYALPMIPGQAAGTYHAAGVGTLQVSNDGKLVYDPTSNVTWLANANLAASKSFGAQCTGNDGKPCIDSDGSMSQTTAEAWIAGMNADNSGTGWLGQTTWQLPPTLDADVACNPNYGCDASPMGELFYDQLGMSAGTSVTATPDTTVGPFNDIQPYLYWSCEGAPYSRAPCFANGPAFDFEYSFSFGNGFEGTDILANDLYVMVYYPDQIFVNGFEPE
jgi:hypothetical protein